MRCTRIVVALAASLLGAVAGAGIAEESPGERMRGRSPARHHEPAGYAARGPSFYVWEEDAREADRWAAELARAIRSPLGNVGADGPGGSSQPTP
jgi:hypothetical protein